MIQSVKGNSGSLKQIESLSVSHSAVDYLSSVIKWMTIYKTNTIDDKVNPNASIQKAPLKSVRVSGLNGSLSGPLWK